MDPSRCLYLNVKNDVSQWELSPHIYFADCRRIFSILRIPYKHAFAFVGHLQANKGVVHFPPRGRETLRDPFGRMNVVGPCLPLRAAVPIRLLTTSTECQRHRITRKAQTRTFHDQPLCSARRRPQGTYPQSSRRHQTLRRVSI